MLLYHCRMTALVELSRNYRYKIINTILFNFVLTNGLLVTGVAACRPEIPGNSVPVVPPRTEATPLAFNGALTQSYCFQYLNLVNTT